MTGFSIRQKRLQAAGLIVCIHHPLQPAQPLCGSLPHSRWGGNLLGEADVLASSLQTSSCAVDELGTPGVFVFQLFTPFPGPTSHSVSTFCVLGLTFSSPARSSVLECSISNDAPPFPLPLSPYSPAHPNHPTFQAQLLPGQTRFQAPLPRASHRCPASLCWCSASLRLRPRL